MFSFPRSVWTLLPRMDISGNEYRTTVFKACRGVGVMYGVAEDVADACLFWASVSLEVPARTIGDALAAYEASKRPMEWSHDGEWVICQNASVLCDGPSVLDLVETGQRVRMVCDWPELLLLLARHRSWRLAGGVEISLDGIEWADALKATVMPDTGVLWLRPGQGGSSASVLSNRVTIDPHEWSRIKIFADKILVPADPANRQDAGAGLTDND